MRVIPLLSLLAACESVDSSDTMTDGIYAAFTATSDGAVTQAQATLRVGGATSNTYVELVDGDILTVTDGVNSETMLPSNIGDYYTYLASFDSIAEDTPFTFAFVRTIDAGAPESTASLPAPFALTAPEADSVFSRADDAITITWDPSASADDMSLTLTGDCIFTHSTTLTGDPGTYVIDAGSLDATDEDNPTSCDAKLTVERRRIGTLDPAFGEGGGIYAAQARTVEIRIDP
jgi:hypothetical protein